MKGKSLGHDEPDRIKGPWSPEEDAALQHFVQKYGPRNWSLISKAIPGRSGKSCRLRWCNQLSPQVEHRPFTPEEDATIVRAHAQHGNKWATIARMLSGRTDNAIKNHWNSTLRRRCQGGGALVIDDEITSGADGFRKRNLCDDADADADADASRKFKKLTLGTTTTTEPCSSSASDRSDSSLVFGSPHIYRPVPRAAPLALSNEANLTLNHHEASCSSTDPPTSLCLSLPGTDTPARPTVALNALPLPLPLPVTSSPVATLSSPVAPLSSPVAPPGYIKTEEAIEWMNSAINNTLSQMFSPILAPAWSHGIMPETLGSSGLLAVMQEMVAKEVRDYMSSMQHRNNNNAEFRGCVGKPPPMGMRVSNSNALG